MKRLMTLLKLALCMAMVLPVLTRADEVSRGIVIKDGLGRKVGLYENSYALVIGVSDYTNGWPDLPGVKADVAAVKEILESQGFAVTIVEDPDDDELNRSFTEFINRNGRRPDDRLLFYFAGHGHTIEMGYGGEMGYIVPADAPNPNVDPDGFKAKAVDMQMMEVYAKRIESKHALFLFDSCFSGSIFALSRAIPDHITYKTANPVRQFITSGSAGETVPDESIFRQEFVAALQGEADANDDGYVTGMELGEFLQEKVVNYSQDSQHPQYGKIRNPNLDKGDFVFQLPEKPMQPPPGPSDDRVSLKELEERAARWASRLKEMEEDFNRIMEFGKRDLPSEVKIQAWEEFLSTFERDNPYSQEDDRMKQEASRQITYWKSQEKPFVEPKPPEPEPAKTGMDGMVLIPAGAFQMGSNDWYDDEKPAHTVYLDAFYIDKYEVTNAQYRKFVEATGHNEPGGFNIVNGKWQSGFRPWSDESFNGDNQPVVCVTWEDAKAYCEWAGKRLPTEAEWEKAARGGVAGKEYIWGDSSDPPGGSGNFADESVRKVLPELSVLQGYDDGYPHTAPVGSFKANGYGLYDMVGNVREWCEDWHGENYYASSPDKSPTGPDSGDYRILRGGSWSSEPDEVRVAFRFGSSPLGAYSDTGFRCAVSE